MVVMVGWGGEQKDVGWGRGCGGVEKEVGVSCFFLQIFLRRSLNNYQYP